MNGELGHQAHHTQKYAERLAQALDLPLIYVDERLSSVQAEELLRAEGAPLSENKGLIDRKAAAIILQRWLDAQRAERNRASQQAPIQDSAQAPL